MKKAVTVPLEFDNVLPELLYDKSKEKIEQTINYHGNQEEPLNKYFIVEIEGKCDKADDLREQVNSLEKDVRSKTREISSLSETIESLNNRISELSTSLSGVQDENSELAPYKEKYELLLEEVETLKDTINNEREKQEKLDNLQEKYSQIENLLYEKLLFERVDIDSLVEYIKAKGIATGNFEVANLLNNMKIRNQHYIIMFTTNRYFNIKLTIFI